MSDLISRKAVLKLIEDIKVDKDIPKNYGTLLDIMSVIRNMPTAYDVDKIVEELKECERYVYDAVSDEDSYVIDTEKAIEIVKGDVKNEYIFSNNYNSLSNNSNN